MAVSPIPEGYQGPTPYLTVHDAAAALDYYQRAFGAVETTRMTDPQGRVGHAEIEVGNGVIMLSDEYPEMGITSPKTLGGTTSALNVYVTDVDAVFAQAVAAGGEVIRPVADQFYGDRSGQLRDPFGHKWSIATHIEDVPPDEMERRAAAVFSQSS